MKKYLYLGLGFISIGLAGLGVALPILPTTPFLLLALVCFSRGSRRWDTWFRNTQLYKKYAADFVQNRAMTLKHKLSILLFADFMLAFPFVLIDNWISRTLIVMIALGKYYYFFFRIRTLPAGKKRAKPTPS